MYNIYYVLDITAVVLQLLRHLLRHTCRMAAGGGGAGGLVLTLVLIQLCQLAGGVRYVGSPAILRKMEDSVKKAQFIIDPTNRNPKDGTVVGWNVYTTRGRRSQTAHLQVWREVNPQDQVWRLVGQTIFVARWVGHNYFPLYPKDRIEIKEGDTVGIYFPKYNPIPWSANACGRENEHMFRYNPRQIEAGRDFRFEKSSSDWNPCRAYSINATIADAEELQNNALQHLHFPNTRRYHGDFLPTLVPPVGGSSRHTLLRLHAVFILAALAAVGIRLN